MQNQKPIIVRLEDYRVADYLIDKTDLSFYLREQETWVQAKLHIRRNPEAGEGLPELALNGEQLDLLEVKLNGQLLSSAHYQVDEQFLRVQPQQEGFVLETKVRIYPHKNTALEGLYQSAAGSMYCTQCEAEGFRKITYYLDRPDVMSRFSVRITADKARYPLLLSNGNLIESGNGENNSEHFALWHDPFPKPCYLFALVAANLSCAEDQFITQSGRKVTLRIYVEPSYIEQVGHAMTSLKKAMRWDEEVYGREYDLDLFMIVAVDDFNMGAMENKGLNIFNTSCLLAHPQTATDAAFQRVEAVVAHEYFHNWSGNRVTCRDWFQLSLKEGFTVFRDAAFSADMNSPTVKRIDDVRLLRTQQFAEDAGPLAHPVRPSSYMEISNFYTLTVYEKGAEVVRMLHSLLGAETFRQGSDLYFARHDGQAVTCDDFVQAMQDASGQDLTQFKRWYSQAGTPQLAVRGEYLAEEKRYLLHFTQSCPPTAELADKQPFVIPVKLALLEQQGDELPLHLTGEREAQGTCRVIPITKAVQSVCFENISSEPVPSLLRGFSAPVKLDFAYSREQLCFLMQHDADGFNRVEAAQQLSLQVLQDLITQRQNGSPWQLDPLLIKALQRVLTDNRLEAAMVAEMLSLPSEAWLVERAEIANIEAIHHAREYARRHLADALHPLLRARYQQLRETSRNTPFAASAEHFARRALQNTALGYLMQTDDDQVLAACLEQFAQSDNLTERLAALVALVNSTHIQEREQALASFATQYQAYPLVMDGWLAVQASSPLYGTLEKVRELMRHAAFNLNNPNRARALIGSFCNQNLLQFHQADGSGYRFLADCVLQLDRLNPQTAARLLTPLTRFRKYDEKHQALMQSELARLQQEPLSKDVFELVSKSLG